MVTRRCNMSCGHCSVESAPGIRGEPEEAELLEWVRAAAAAGVRSIRLTGGEPMLRAATVLRLVRECRRLGMATTVNSNGFWGRSTFEARRQLRALKRAGLGSMIVSYDQYHAEFQGAEPTLRIADAADRLSVPIRITTVRGSDETPLTDVVRRLEASHGTRLTVYDLQPVGRARRLPLESHRAEIEGFCAACAFPAVTDDGRLIACNGPAYFERPDSPLVVGSLRDTPLADLIDQHQHDPILETIRTRGPAGLRDELKKIPGFDNFPFRSRYAGICELCHQVTRSPDAVAALRARLDRPEAAASRLATRQVMAGNRRHGSLNPTYLAGIGAAGRFFAAARNPAVAFGEGTERILGRADVDWRALAGYLAGSGLARPLLPSLTNPNLARWAPQFFLASMRASGISDAARELVQRESIRRIAGALHTLGGQGVLLKGTALLLRGSLVPVPRATTDVDILVDPVLAPRLRAQLMDDGFEGRPDAPASSSHHLDPLLYQGVPVEIHTRVMPPFWGLPEREMLATAHPLPDQDALAAMGPEALLLHACAHASGSFFSFGLRTAWDVFVILQTSSDVDWDRLARWANASHAPRGFWTPLRVLAEELDLPIPREFLAHAPDDRGARRVAMIARHRLFRAGESLFDLDVVTKAGLMLLVQDRWMGRARYLGATIGWRGARPGTWRHAAARARRADVFGQAWRQYQRYRRAVDRG